MSDRIAWGTAVGRLVLLTPFAACLVARTPSNCLSLGREVHDCSFCFRRRYYLRTALRD